MKFAALLLFAVSASAQSVSDHNANGWFMYFGDHPIAKTRWGVHLEGQWRRNDVALQWQQLLLRPAVNFQVNKKVSLTAGYGYIRTHGYGDFPAPATAPEHRFFEQVTITPRVKNLDFQNRLRLEQRNLGVMTPQRTGWRYENRLRYLLRANVPLAKDGKYYLGLYNEIMFNYGKNVLRNVFDQNRAYVALGRDIGHETKFEVGFMEQTLQRRGGLIFEHNHTLQVAIYSKLPLGW